MSGFTIKDLENLSGIKAHTIRIWEQRYHFLKPRRTTTNIRYYSNEELRTILNVALLNKYGFKISRIDKMEPQEICEKILSLDDASAIVEKIINDLVQEMAELNMQKFETIIEDYIRAKGIEQTIIQVIFPFLEKIGILWQTGHINPAQEHMVSNIVRQKIIVAIDGAKPSFKLDKTFLLFLPEGEHHELGLLFVHFVLKARGAETIYLGTNVPAKDVKYIVNLKKPDFVFVHLTATTAAFNFDKFLTTMHRDFDGIPVILSGRITQHYWKKLPPSVRFKRSLAEVMEYISSI